MVWSLTLLTTAAALSLRPRGTTKRPATPAVREKELNLPPFDLGANLSETLDEAAARADGAVRDRLGAMGGVDATAPWRGQRSAPAGQAPPPSFPVGQILVDRPCRYLLTTSTFSGAAPSGLAKRTIFSTSLLMRLVNRFGAKPKTSNIAKSRPNAVATKGFASDALSQSSPCEPCKIFRIARSM